MEVGLENTTHSSKRARAAIKATLLHLLGSILMAALAAALVLLIWYPHPYGLLSGGLHLFLIVVSVDVVCGPLLTLVLFNPKKPRRELVMDMSLVILIQLSALVYGMHTAYQARPLFLVHEVDRFRVIALPDYGGEEVTQALAALPAELQPRWFGGPVTVGTRDPRDAAEREAVMLDAVFGGRDYSQRPEFYVPYDDAYRRKILARAKPLEAFTERFPESIKDAHDVVRRHAVAASEAFFLPVMHKQEWVAVMDGQARILGFLPGDGFAVP